MHPSKNAIDYAAAVRDWISSPHSPDEDLDVQLAELTQAHFEALFEACRLYEEAFDHDCECDKAHEGGHCPFCNRVEKARARWSRFAERCAKLNPDWTELLEQELDDAKSHRDAWLWAYSLIVSVIEGRPGWETAKTAYPLPRSEELMQFPAVNQAKGFRKSFEQLERRLGALEQAHAEQIKRYTSTIDALRRICSYPVHSEPMGGAMAMKDIALDTLDALKEPIHT